MTALRVLVSMVILAGAAWLIERYCVEPWLCNREIEQTIRNSESVAGASLDREAVVARENVARLRHCRVEPSQLTARNLVLGANLVTLRRHDEAVAVYLEALRHDRRPELYLSLGNAYMHVPDLDAALEAYLRAYYFTPTVSRQIPDVVIRDRARVIASNWATIHKAEFDRILGALYRGEQP